MNRARLSGFAVSKHAAIHEDDFDQGERVIAVLDGSATHAARVVGGL